MTNFVLKNSDEIFTNLTDDFHELIKYLMEQEIDDVDLCTIVLDGCAQFLAEYYKDEKILDKTLIYIESVIAEAHKAEEVKITIFESLYSQHFAILSELKNKFKKNTKSIYEEWFINKRKKIFGE